MIQRALILSPDGVISMNDISLSATKPPTATVGTTLEEIERNHIQRMLTTTLWRIEGRRGAAELLGLKPSTLRSRCGSSGSGGAQAPPPTDRDADRHRGRPRRVAT